MACLNSNRVKARDNGYMQISKNEKRMKYEFQFNADVSRMTNTLKVNYTQVALRP